MSTTERRHRAGQPSEAADCGEMVNMLVSLLKMARLDFRVMRNITGSLLVMLVFAEVAVHDRYRDAAVKDRIFNILDVECYALGARVTNEMADLLSNWGRREPDAPAIDKQSAKTKAEVSRPEVAFHETSEFRVV